MEQVSLLPLLITPAQAKKKLVYSQPFPKRRKWFWSTSYRCAQLPIKNLSVGIDEEPLKTPRKEKVDIYIYMYISDLIDR